MTSAQETGGSSEWNQSYTYDQWGNRAVSGNDIPNAYATPTALTQYANNRWLGSGASYDTNGNQQSLPSRSFTYDAENRLSTTSQPGMGAISYAYDGQGHRVQKTVGTTVTNYVYDAAGQLTAEYGAQATTTGTLYLMADALGSTRMVLDGSGNTKELIDYLPFGEEIGAPIGARTTPAYSSGIYPSNPDIESQKFTSKERDAETGLDWFEHRYMSSAQGRLTSPDPVFANVQRLFDPQGWNLYAYVRNNPLTLTDPDGLDFYQTCTHTDSNGSTCQQVPNGSSNVWAQGTSNNGQFTANRIANDANGNLVDTAHGNAAVQGTFDQNGVHFNGSTTANGQFIEGSNATKIGGSGTFDGITGNFFSACGGSCQARGTLTGTSDAFAHMKAGLIQQGSFSSFLDGFSGAHPFNTTQWKDAGGYVHMIKAPGYIMDMHFEGSTTGGGLEQRILHSVSTIGDLFSGAAAKQKSMMTPGKDPDEK